MFRDGKWRIWAALAGFASAVGFTWHQYQATLASRPPAALQIRDHHSQRIEGLRDPDSVWHVFQSLLREARASAESRSIENYSASLLELQPNGNDAVFWWGETVANPSFQSQSRVERQLWGEASHVLG